MLFRKCFTPVIGFLLAMGVSSQAFAADDLDTGDRFEPQPMCSISEPTSYQPTLREGHYGIQVELMQSLLGITADGCFGPGTGKAVRAFQLRHSLYVDGIVGGCTWRVLRGNAPTSGCVSQSGSEVGSTAPTGERHIVINQWREIVQLKAGDEVIDTMPMIDNHYVLAKGTYRVCEFIRSNMDYSHTWKLPNFVRLCKEDGTRTYKGFHAIPIRVSTGVVMHDDSFLGTGKKQSSGCIRLSLADSQILWDFAKSGMKILVV